ncbi:hypothetical protein CSKR_106265 [Clonorchis sinensis]|uniref:Uncharacterized protein n=1 Tax=Clonorchis sinensis TaxID=79923 RepID=A0A419PSS9_CLOSI|nr:hypothetical protein CSKR_106265 [Clonorchis sinensis]
MDCQACFLPAPDGLVCDSPSHVIGVIEKVGKTHLIRSEHRSWETLECSPGYRNSDEMKQKWRVNTIIRHPCLYGIFLETPITHADPEVSTADGCSRRSPLSVPLDSVLSVPTRAFISLATTTMCGLILSLSPQQDAESVVKTRICRSCSPLRWKQVRCTGSSHRHIYEILSYVAGRTAQRRPTAGSHSTRGSSAQWLITISIPAKPALEREFTNRKVHGSNRTFACRLPVSMLGKPDSIPALVLRVAWQLGTSWWSSQRWYFHLDWEDQISCREPESPVEQV